MEAIYKEIENLENVLMVNPLNAEKVLEKLNALLPLENGDEYRVDLMAYACENVLIDTDCCYRLIPERFHNDKVQCVHDIGVRIKRKKEDGSFTMRMDKEDFEFPISEEETHLFCDAQISLKEYMGSRWAYNSRIKQNTINFLKTVGFEIHKNTLEEQK